MSRVIMQNLTETEKKKIVEQHLSERNKSADRLVESFRKKKGIGGEGFDKLIETNRSKARNLAIRLENQKNKLLKLSETAISTQFAQTPENLMRVIALAYRNSIRDELFYEYGMQTMRDSMYFLNPVYKKTARGATANTIMHESTAYRYGTELELEEIDATGAGTNYTGTFSEAPIRPFKVSIIVDGAVVAADDGRGAITGFIDTNDIVGTIDYDNGAYDITFDTAPGFTIEAEYSYNSEDSTLYDNLGDVDLQLRDIQFRPTPKVLGISFSNMTQFLLESTLNVDAEKALNEGGAGELRKALDYIPLRRAYREAKKKTAVTFSADWVSAGASSESAFLETSHKIFNKAGQKTYDKLSRGAIPTKAFGGSSVTNWLTRHPKFVADMSMEPQGAFKLGTIGRTTIYQVPNDICPADEIVTVYKNESVEGDAAMAIGDYIPVASTMMLEYKNLYKENALYNVSDVQVLTGDYIQRIKVSDLEVV